MNDKRAAICAALFVAACIAQPAFARESESQIADTPVPENAPDVVSAKPAAKQPPKTEAAWQIKPRWRLQYDVIDIDGPAGLAGVETLDGIRRARLGVDIQMPAGFSARIDSEFQADPIVFVDAYLQWERGNVSVTAGQFKINTPLDLHMSNLNTSFIERPAFFNAFNYTRGTGVNVGYENERFGVYAAVTTDPLILLNDVKENSISADFKAFWTPSMDGASLHFGGTFRRRSMNDFASESTRYRQRPFTRLSETRYIGTPSLRVDKETRFGLEAAASRKRFHAAAELHWLEASRPALPDPRFFGGYGEVGFFLTNDTRPLKGAEFRAIKPKKPLGEGGLGAVQLNFRYDYLNLNSAGIVGGKQDGYMASLIWTPVSYLRFMVNYARLDYQDAIIAVAGSRDYSVDVLGLRTQMSF